MQALQFLSHCPRTNDVQVFAGRYHADLSCLGGGAQLPENSSRRAVSRARAHRLRGDISLTLHAYEFGPLMVNSRDSLVGLLFAALLRLPLLKIGAPLVIGSSW
jgi:hypothetical protein